MKIQKAIDILSYNVSNVRKVQRRDTLQRRYHTVDFYGYEFTRNGNQSNPAVVGISISQDLVYYERFEFKLIVQPIPVATEDGITLVPSNPANMKVTIEGVDLTPYFKAQYDGHWINGNGTYPNAGTANYDVLQACGLLSEEERQKVLSAGYKKVVITADGPFQVTLVNYLKYSHVAR
ncbi:hypothetical protein [uncultured Dubosiella sp.]|uniref:hypothetical protein n=1 Tax=uncultured Dubosiella sp. TaxID=1937011 RepID=UPI00272E45CD|nr:hypothetical protein [uncultured Dubosiella sp.]